MKELINNEWKNEDWYILLIEDLQAIIVESVYNSSIDLIQGKWLFGERTYQENDNFERKKIYGKDIVKNIAGDLERSERDIYYCLEFYEKFPEKDFALVVQYLPEGKSISWNKVRALLPETTAKEKELDENIKVCNHCPRCGYEW